MTQPVLVTYASFGRRLWAFVLALVLDLVVLGALAAVGVGDYLGELWFGWMLLHHVGLVTEGGTLGHRLAGTRVVRFADGARLGPVRAGIRVVVELASLAPLGLGALWMLDQRDRRTWHDLAAGSVVVRDLVSPTVVGPAWADPAVDVSTSADSRG